MLWAYIDEAGQAPTTPLSSNHFILSAVIVDSAGKAQIPALLAGLRAATGRGATHHLHWRNIKNPAHRNHIATTIGTTPYLVIITIVVAKRHLPSATLIQSGNTAYLFTLRMMLERLSWLAEHATTPLTTTIAHMKGLPIPRLRSYERILKNYPGCNIHWQWLSPNAVVGSPKVTQELQLPDLVASSTFRAFEPDRAGATNQTWLRATAPRHYRGRTNKLTSYGLKMHPWNAGARASYPWVLTL